MRAASRYPRLRPSAPSRPLVGLSLLGSLGIALVYWSFFIGVQMVTMAIIWLRGYRPEEMFVAADLLGHPKEAPEAPLALQNLVSRPLTHIPSIMHHTWKTKNLSSLPPDWRECHDSCRKLHVRSPTPWTFFLWTDDEARRLVADNYPWFLPTFDGYRFPIQRVDAFRYFALYHYGGVYLDMDIGCNKPLDPLLAALPPGVAVFPETDSIGVSNDMMMAPQRHPFLLHLIQALGKANHWYGSSYPTVCFSTGPAFVSINIFHASPAQRMGLRILAFGLYGPVPGSLLFHRQGSSWHSSDAGLIKLAADWLFPFVHLGVVRTLQLIFAGMALLLVWFYGGLRQRLRSIAPVPGA